jgi:hypothetical protein
MGAFIMTGEESVLSIQGNHPNILPISGGTSRYITGGIRSIGAVFAGSIGSGAPLVILFTSSSVQVMS